MNVAVMLRALREGVGSFQPERGIPQGGADGFMIAGPDVKLAAPLGCFDEAREVPQSHDQPVGRFAFVAHTCHYTTFSRVAP